MLRRLIAALLISAPGLASAQSLEPYYVENLTWTELAAQEAAGKTTIIIPVGGIEQSGPDMALGKHDARVRYLAGRIASRLGNALVAPVISYVPEGDVSPPTAHMRFPGTITVPPAIFRATVEFAALSFAVHGFKNIVLIGDHGGYQNDLRICADHLNEGKAGRGYRVEFIPQYYTATQTSYVASLRRSGFSAAEIGTHAGLADTSLTLAIAPGMVRAAGLRSGRDLTVAYGVHGDPRRSTAQLGAVGVEQIISQSVAAIQQAVAAGSPGARR